MPRLRLNASVVLIAGALVGTCAAQEPPPGTFCWPMHYAGVVPGVTTDGQVARLLGHGAYRREDYEGTRYFVNRERTATFRVVSCTYLVVCEMTLQVGVIPTLTASEVTRAVSPHFDLAEGFGKWHKLSLGSTKADVAANLGEPARKNNADEWVYDAEHTCELPEYMTLFFHDGKITRVVFSAPDG